MNNKIKEIIWIVLTIVTFILLQAAILFVHDDFFQNYKGVVLALQFGICLLLLQRNRKHGIVVSMLLMGISLFTALKSLVINGITSTVPGICNTLFYITTIIIIAGYYKEREKESVTDLLTGVYNRRGLYKYLQNKTEAKKGFSVICFCLDNFKFINDTYGHAYGDELLREICSRVNKSIDKSGCVARIGGAEFVVVLNGDIDVEKEAGVILDRVRERANLSVDGLSVDCYITAYAGVASYPKDAQEYEALIKYADIAMFEAVYSKSKSACIFDRTMAESMNRQIFVEKMIKEGLANDLFYLVYQPQFYLDNRKLRGFESLLRLKTADGQMVSPGEFIPVAERGDLIFQIDDYVMKRAMQEFRDIVINKKGLVISVNVSAKNIGSVGFTDKVSRILLETGYPASNLEIEITEYCMVDSMEVTIQNITRLREMGIQIALDDFGTGYTSLSYVAKLPINLLKVDKSLVDDIDKSDKNKEFVHTVVSMGHLMGCEVITEGVEMESQLDYLKEFECDFVQGYVWGRPLEYEKAVELVSLD